MRLDINKSCCYFSSKYFILLVASGQALFGSKACFWPFKVRSQRNKVRLIMCALGCMGEYIRCNILFVGRAGSLCLVVGSCFGLNSVSEGTA